MDPPLHSTDPVAWLVYSDWLEEQGRTRAAIKCRRVAAGLGKQNRLVLISCSTSCSIWSQGRTVVNRNVWNAVNMNATVDSTRIHETKLLRLGWLRPDNMKTGWTGVDFGKYPDWQSTPADYPGMIERLPRLAWKFFLTLARLAEGKEKRAA